MPPLPSNLRNDLGRVIVKARQAAESGARNALDSLAVGHHEPHGSMSLEDRALRNRLRARGRQLGDVRDKQRGSQSIDRLLHEVAYEHWHRMLFARYLAENNLLIHPEHKVAVSLDEVEELARDAGMDPRDLSAQYAQGALPQIFRSGDPVLAVTLPPESRQALDKLLDSLPSEVFTADDSLGWTYQYWQTEKKDEINESGDKIGADELPAVTQLFTEHYMVLFLYHNTIGAWHAGKVLAANPSLAETAQSEEELRDAVAVHTNAGEEVWEYLRFVREQLEGDEDDTPTGPWRPAAGTFEGWPTTAKELKVLDPCCGSGHFLVVGFKLLVRLRMHEEGLSVEDAINAVLTDNLFGLELDPRCTQIAAFNVAMAAWSMAGKPIDLPEMHIACSGLAVGSTKAEWTKLAEGEARLESGMGALYDLFEQAPELGSLIDPKSMKDDLFNAAFSELQPLLEQALQRESDDVEDTERAISAHGMARAAELLSGEYTLVITNVPYLGRRKQSKCLREFCELNFPQEQSDLANVIIGRMLHLIGKSGSIATVCPQNWLFLTTFEDCRKQLLSNQTWNVVAKLGAGAFQTPMWDYNIQLLVLSNQTPDRTSELWGLDVSTTKDIRVKSDGLRGSTTARFPGSDKPHSRFVSQSRQLENPDSAVILEEMPDHPLLKTYAYCYQGAGLADIKQFRLRMWEVCPLQSMWSLHQSSPRGDTEFTGMHFIVFWEDGNGELATRTAMSGQKAWGNLGIAIAWLGNLPASLYVGTPFDNSAAVMVANDPEMTLPIWCYCNSPEFNRDVRRINQKAQVANATMVKVPFDLDHWTKVAAEKYPNGLPEPQSNDPTQWLFHGHPAGMLEADDARSHNPAAVLQVAVGRLLGYQWPPELDPEMRLDKVAREWVGRCDELKEFADEDGIVCLSATRGERSAADRVRELLAAALGPDWSSNKEREFLAAIAAGQSTEMKTVKPAASLEDWLRDDFFAEHCNLFHHRPFVWHIWDGNKNGFHCLVNAHKITGPDGEARRTLEAITYSYLGDWIDRQKADQADGKEGADARLASAQDLQGQLEKILEGEAPYDLFVRWKALHEQAVGWEPDINDGVRLNIRPFMTAELSKGGKKGAGLLRWKPNIKWNKDRGKEPQSLRPKVDFPWFWSCDDLATDFAGGKEFDGNRWNDLHCTRATKEAAREVASHHAQHEVVT